MTHKITLTDLDFHYGTHQVLNRVNAVFTENAITAVIGPSGQGKSSLLTVMNRLWVDIPGARAAGSALITLGNKPVDVITGSYSLPRLRRKAGMVFQIPNPLPMSIFKNVAFPLKLAGITDPKTVPGLVEQALQNVFLWHEVKDRLNADARTLSGGQQQRLCFARALILEPEILLLDEPASSLDAKATEEIENLMTNLKSSCTLVVVSHFMEQVKRIADKVYALENGGLTDVTGGM